MNCEKLCKKVTVGIFFAVIIVFLLLIMGQFIIKNVLVETLHMDNFITDMLVTGKSDGSVGVDWEGLYPYKEAHTEPGSGPTKKQNPYVAKVRSVFDNLDNYTNDFLPFKEYVKVPSGLFDKLIGNKMIDTDNVFMHTGKDGLIVRSPFYQKFTEEELDASVLVENVAGLRDYLEDSGIDFLYVQAPIKEDKYDAEYVAEYGLSYENQLADSLMAGLRSEDIDVLDLRDVLHESGMDCYEAFFETDNHWTIDTAFWATGVIAEKLNADYGFSFDLEYFNTDNYDNNVYEEWVQGTIGRGVTLANANYDDVSVFVPKFETNLTMKIPSLGMDNTGTFLETMINPEAFERRSTVYQSAYDAFAYSKPPVTEVTNNLETGNSEKSVLLLRESFAGPVITYMSLGIEKLYAVTPEGFTGSIESYINEVQPDMVVILYTAPPTNEMTSKYDFK